MLMRAGMRDLTLRGVGIELADLTMLATLRHLSRCTATNCVREPEHDLGNVVIVKHVPR